MFKKKLPNFAPSNQNNNYQNNPKSEDSFSFGNDLNNNNNFGNNFWNTNKNNNNNNKNQNKNFNNHDNHNNNNHNKFDNNNGFVDDFSSKKNDHKNNNHDFDTWNGNINHNEAKKARDIVINIGMQRLEKFIDFITNPEKVQKELNKDRYMWRNTLLSRQKALLSSLDDIDDPKSRYKIKTAIIKYSKILLETAQNDLKLPQHNKNAFEALKEVFSNTGNNIKGQKTFWAQTIDMQSDILHNLEKHSINTGRGSEEQVKKFINLNSKLNAQIFDINDMFCDLLLVQITKNESKENPNARKKYEQINDLKEHSRLNLAKLIKTKASISRENSFTLSI